MIAVAILIWAGLTALGGWTFMLMVGVIHAEWIPACPTIGFWWALLISVLLRLTLLQQWSDD